MEHNLASGDLNVARPAWNHQRLVPRIVHIGCGAFHRAHQALYLHHLLATSDCDWGICEVNLMSASGKLLVEQLRQQDLLYSVTEKGAEQNDVHIIAAIKEALHPALDGHAAIIEALARPETAIVSLTVTEKGYCTQGANGALDADHPLIQHDVAHPDTPKSAIGFIVEALRLRHERGLKPFSVLSCDNLRDNGHVARAAVVGLAQLRDPSLAQWIAANVTFPSCMVDRIVPAVTEETQQEISALLGVNDPCGVACEPFRQWVIEDNFVNGRPDWDRVGAQFVTDVAPFEMMKLRMLNGSHSFLAYLGYLGRCDTIADTMQLPEYRQAAINLMMHEQVPTLSMPEGIDLQAYADQLIARFSNPALRHRTQQIAMDGSQKLPQRWLDSVRHHLLHGSDYRHLALGIAGWMRYVLGQDERGEAYNVVDPLSSTLQQVNQHYPEGDARVTALLAVKTLFGDDLPANTGFVATLQQSYAQLCQRGARAAVASPNQEPK
ncbi:MULTISPECIES: fructuronate reductase [Pantoea]|uniref:D-mannonate oxidoreductase n=2 Tax=Pantoea TaxID=53335 RepID=A0A0U3UR29_9GAMM|nr:MULTISPECIES: fructuronate reductase [Pantoea]ALV92345.1 D-mannonate oxidoreductase [Pantoea vagans]KHJ69026.1 D-mannonate oxidoreductase [Pantoea rodasii]